MRSVMIRRLLTPALQLLALLLLVGSVRAEAKSEKTHEAKVKGEFMEKGKPEEKDFDLDNPADVKQLSDLLKEGKVVSVEVEKPPELLKLHWDLGLWTLVVFLGLMFVLSKVAWKPMLEGLRNREDNIRKALDDAELSKKETAEMRQKFQSEMDKTNEKVRDMLEAGRRDAQRTADELLAKAKADIQAERDRLRREMDVARDQAIKELWEQTATLATQVSSKAVRRQMNVDDHRRLVDEALTELRQAAAANKAQMN